LVLSLEHWKCPPHNIADVCLCFTDKMCSCVKLIA
jgi:hypothetical protein